MQINGDIILEIKKVQDSQNNSILELKKGQEQQHNSIIELTKGQEILNNSILELTKIVNLLVARMDVVIEQIHDFQDHSERIVLLEKESKIIDSLPCAIHTKSIAQLETNSNYQQWVLGFLFTLNLAYIGFLITYFIKK